jgi:hypothetical protein
MGVAGYRSPQRNTHSTDARIVRYRWHPWSGREVWVHQARRSPGSSETIVRCSLTPDLDARSVEIALWMFDVAACSVMPLATAPAVDVETLRELRILLTVARPAKSGCPPSGFSPQAEHLELPASGGAHVHDCHGVASGDATDALPTASPGPVLGGDAPRTSAAGRTPAGPYAPRARPAAARKGTGAGDTR